MTLKIERVLNEKFVVFTLSGRIESEHMAEFQKLLEAERQAHHIVLDLQEVKLVDQDTVRFLARCEADGAQLENCPAYIREWIVRERDQSQKSQQL